MIEVAVELEIIIENVVIVNVIVMVEKIDVFGVIINENVEIVNGEVIIDVNGFNLSLVVGLLEVCYCVDGGGWINWKC